MSTFSDNLSQLRRSRRMSQRYVAAKLDISQALLSHYEHGIREPKLSFVAELAQFYGVSSDYLLGITSTVTPDTQYCVESVARVLSITKEKFGDRAHAAVCANVEAVVTRLSAFVDKPFQPLDPDLSVAVSVSEAKLINSVRTPTAK